MKMLINYEIIEKVDKVNKIINSPDEVPEMFTALIKNKKKVKKDEINKDKK